MLYENVPARAQGAKRWRWARVAAWYAFFVNGVVISTWMTRIPAVKDHAHVTSGELGTAMMTSVIGSLVAMQVTGRVATRMSSRTLLGGSILLLSGALAALPLSRNQSELTGGLLWLGLADGALYVSMNTQAVAVERVTQRPHMNTFHAAWSIGALAGSALAAGFTRAGWGAAGHLSVVAGAVACTCVPMLGPAIEARKQHVAAAGRGRRDWKAGWSRRVLVLGGLGCCCLVAEGAIGDWSAVFLDTERSASAFTATLGYTAFSTALTLVRLTGDRLRLRFGTTRLIRFSAFLAVAGLLSALVIPVTVVTIIGFGLFGAGLSPIDPIVSSEAGRAGASGSQDGDTAAIASVATLSHAGMLLGPPVIGWTAQFTGLSMALLLPAVLVVAIGCWAQRITEPVDWFSSDTGPR